ncbi:methyltransferase domain-containing protein [Aquibium sp. ELW1220]|uniref:methyltransferase domain-containing protein n=1 Tax=Aquibium sp. ELW1220 TaxID=2976766 RepID=UPI0025B08E99|nr:methyltransferase domain-containing protein [Aquibium sp. ELW1220]MDN2578360.1 methyltransferase domain-containing protein [Aquibium sp. ELW1220]
MEVLFETGLVVQRRKRARAQAADGADFLLRRVAEDLVDRLSTVERRFAKAAVVKGWTPLVAEALAASGKVGDVLRIEADPSFLDEDEGLVADGDRLPFEPGSLDLVVSLLNLQEADDMPGQLIQIRRALRPDGLFMACLAGAGTLAELRDCLLAAETDIMGGASPRIIPFADVRDIGGLLQRAGFALPVADVETVGVRYGDMFGLMRDLRSMGATNPLRGRLKHPTRRAVFLRAAEIYAERFSDADGRVRATFNLVWMSGWAPHESQQKPLKPGSGTISLAEALKSREGS